MRTSFRATLRVLVPVRVRKNLLLLLVVMVGVSRTVVVGVAMSRNEGGDQESEDCGGEKLALAAGRARQVGAYTAAARAAASEYSLRWGQFVE